MKIVGIIFLISRHYATAVDVYQGMVGSLNDDTFFFFAADAPQQTYVNLYSLLVQRAEDEKTTGVRVVYVPSDYDFQLPVEPEVFAEMMGKPLSIHRTISS